MRTMATATAALILLLAPGPAAELRGPARVIDGDTFEDAGQAVRLFGKIISCSERGLTP